MGTKEIVEEFPQREGIDRLAKLEEVLQPHVERYSLTKEVDRAKGEIRVSHKVGFSGVLKLEGDQVRATLKYNLLVRPWIDRIVTGVRESLRDMTSEA